MNFRYLQLLFPVLVALHNAEEAIGMPRAFSIHMLTFGDRGRWLFLKGKATQLPGFCKELNRKCCRWARRSGPWFAGVQPAVFRFAVVVLTVLAFVITVLSAVWGRTTLWGNLTFGYMIAMLFNALVPHIAVSIAKRTPMPGVITAAVLNVPILSWLTVLALKQGYVTRHDALVFSWVVPVLLLLMIPLLFQLGKVLGFGRG